VSRRAALLCAAALLLVVAGLALHEFVHRAQADASLRERLQSRLGAAGLPPVACVDAGQRPLVLLVLGQSNAGNHGRADGDAGEALTVLGERGCVRSADPLPGATGRGASVWTRLPGALRRVGVSRPLLFVVLAVDASSLRDWTAPDSPLQDSLLATLAQLRQGGIAPDLVLWQHGEADAARGTSGPAYGAGLQVLASLLHEQQVRAPILPALATVCRSVPDAALRQAIAALPAADARFRAGPDIDQLAAARFRHDGCHLGAQGLLAAADLWAGAIRDALGPAAVR
jgi:hypothetical protein